MKDSGSDFYDNYDMKEKWLGKAAQGNARKMENSIIFGTNPNSCHGAW